jgi:transcription elongation factor Elf1
MGFNPTCPYCNEEIDFFAHYDIEDNGTEIYCKANGECPTCHKSFKWTETFVLNEFIDLEEI